MKAVVMTILLAVGLSCSRLEAQTRVDAIYQQHCAICHGDKLDGGLGGSLINGEWKYGDSPEEIFTSIAKGIPDADMQPFEEVLTSRDIHALVVYIREQEQRAMDRQAPDRRADVGKVVETTHHRYRMEEVVPRGLQLPWGMAFLPDGRMLVTERPGALRIVSAAGELQTEPIEGTPTVVHHGQGGMMEVALHPDYEQNGWIYLGFADGIEGGGNRTLTAFVRGRLDGNRWVDQEWIWRADPKFYTTAGQHFGTRIVFQDGYVFLIVGERGGMHQALDLARPNGKIFRLHDDGRMPDDNPFMDKPFPGIWTYGHRNPQGMAIDPRNGDIYVTEHGPRGGDELNLLGKGNNYGWPEVTHGINYSGTPITDKTEAQGITAPILDWTPSIAPCGLDFYTGDQFPKWKNDLFAGSLRNQTLRRLRLAERQVVEEEVIVRGAGRIRQVITGPDGFLYIALNGPDRIVRLIPADEDAE